MVLDLLDNFVFPCVFVPSFLVFFPPGSLLSCLPLLILLKSLGHLTDPQLLSFHLHPSLGIHSVFLGLDHRLETVPGRLPEPPGLDSASAHRLLVSRPPVNHRFFSSCVSPRLSLLLPVPF